MRPPHLIIKVKDAGARWCPPLTLIFTTVSAEHERNNVEHNNVESYMYVGNDGFALDC